MDRFILEELKPGASALSTCWGFGTLVGAIASAAASQYFPGFGRRIGCANSMMRPNRYLAPKERLSCYSRASAGTMKALQTNISPSFPHKFCDVGIKLNALHYYTTKAYGRNSSLTTYAPPDLHVSHRQRQSSLRWRSLWPS